MSKRKEEIGVAVELMKELSASEIEYQRYLAREKYLMDERSKKGYAEYKMRLVEEKAAKTMQEAAKTMQEAAKTIQEAEKTKEEATKTKEEATKIRQEAEAIQTEAKKYIEEANAKLEQIAVSLLDVLDDETIALKTGLSIEKVRDLRR